MKYSEIHLFYFIYLLTRRVDKNHDFFEKNPKILSFFI